MKWPAACGCVTLLFASGCREPIAPISLQGEGRVMLGNAEVSESDAKTIRRSLAAAKGRWVEIASDTKPAHVLIADGKTFSVYPALGVLCEGSHLEQWTDHMEGNGSACHALPESVRAIAEAPPASPSPTASPAPVVTESTRPPPSPTATATAITPDSVQSDCSCCGYTGGAFISDEHQRGRQEAYQDCVKRGGGCGGGCPRPPSAAPRPRE